MAKIVAGLAGRDLTNANGNASPEANVYGRPVTHGYSRFGGRNALGVLSSQIFASPTGVASGVLPLTGATTGSVTDTGIVTGTIDLAGTATGTTGTTAINGAASGTFDLAGAATGSVTDTGVSSGVIDLFGSATGTTGNVQPTIIYGDDAETWLGKIRSKDIARLEKEIAALKTAAPAKRKKQARQIIKELPAVSNDGFKAVRDGLKQLADGSGWHLKIIAEIETIVARQAALDRKRRRNNEAALLLLIA